ncbi:hypothetical protein BH11PLA1_BH11PLA1_07300 [soil metagenome]
MRRARFGGDGGGWRRWFVAGQSPLDWSLLIGRVFGVTVRVHLLLIFYVLFTLLNALTSGSAIGAQYAALGLGTLFLSVLLHEFGHVFACRWVGGDADDILLWPLGGLAYCRPPHAWRASLITTLGGPGVNVVLMVIAGGVVLALGGGGDSLVFNPFAPGQAMGTFQMNTAQVAPGGLAAAAAFAKTGVWWFYYTNFVLLAFNMLLPMYPMDGGRVLQELMWARMGYARSLRIAATIGLGVAIALAVYGMTGDRNATMLFGIALFGGFTCWAQLQRVKFDETAGLEESPYAASLRMQQEDVPRAKPSARQVRAAEKAKRAEEAARAAAEKHQAELDRILSKITKEGMAGLTSGEKKFLESDSARRKGG